MSKLYDYLITVYKVLVGLITTKRLILIALGAIAFYLVWITFSLMTCFQKKFSRRCNKLYNFIRKNQMTPTNLKVVDMMSEKISSGFYHGWKKFKNSANAKPSDFITRREALDVEVSGGVLNQGKTLMRSFIATITAILFMFNLAYLGSDSSITSFLIAESMMLPLIFYVIIKLFYFLYTSIKQQLYKNDIQSFYEVVGLLDEVFGVNMAVVPATQTATAVVDSPAEGEVELESQEEAEQAEEQEAIQEEIDDNPLRSLDRYDVFKKKNIDVDKIINEVPHNSGTSLPYINVDSDYVIKDDGKTSSLDKIITEEDNATSILGGMMQDRASLKKNNANFLDVDKPIAEIDNQKLEEAKAEEEAKALEETKAEEVTSEEPAIETADENSEVNPFGSLDQFEVAENAVTKTEEQEAKIEETAEVSETSAEETAPVEEKVEEPAPVEPVAEPEPVAIEPEPNTEEIEKETIANVVSGFKSNRSKLASGGVIIERNEPIARRERPVIVEEPVAVTPSVIDDFNDMKTSQSYYQAPTPAPVQNTVRQLSADNNADDILNSLKTSAGGYDYGYQAPSFDTSTYNQGYGYQNPSFAQPTTPSFGSGFGGQIPNGYGYQNPSYTGQMNTGYGEVNQNPYNQNFDAYNQNEDMEEVDNIQEEFAEEVVEEAPVKPAKKVRTKENEPRPRNLKKKVAPKVEENVTPAKTRGRPKKQEVSESMVIKNDKEFNDVLSRAEKLMRKSDEGLSASQSKRIEKELKMLMDAMSRYKESK